MDKLPKELLNLLACPVCKGELSYDEKKEVLVCDACGVFYEVRDGIPDLIPEQARPLNELYGEAPPERQP